MSEARKVRGPVVGGRVSVAARILAALLLGPWIAPAGAGGESSPSLPDDPLAGRLLFESKGCVRCHGIAGGEPSIGPSLGEGHFSGSFLDLGASLWNHVPGMSVSFGVAGLTWPQITEGEAIELLAFLYFVDYLGRPGVAAAGQRVFEQQGCAFCHDIAGGASEVGPDLAELRRFASPLYVAQEIWNHGPSMMRSMREMNMPAPSFEEGDLADLSAFIRQRAEAGPQQPLLLAPGNPNLGRQIFAAKGCTTCHGDGGLGGDGGPDLSQTDLHRSAEGIAGAMWNHALAMGDAMRERGVGWPSFSGSELADLVAFLYFLPFADPPGSPERGLSVFENRSCADCHRSQEPTQEAGTGGGPDLSATSSTARPAALLAAMWNHAPIMKRTILRQGHPWPELTGADLRDLRSYLRQLGTESPPPEP